MNFSRTIFWDLDSSDDEDSYVGYFPHNKRLRPFPALTLYDQSPPEINPNRSWSFEDDDALYSWYTNPPDQPFPGLGTDVDHDSYNTDLQRDHLANSELFLGGNPLLKRYYKLVGKINPSLMYHHYSSGRGLLGTDFMSVEHRRRCFLFLVGNGFPRKDVVGLMASWVPQGPFGSRFPAKKSHKQVMSQMLHGFFVTLEKGMYYEGRDEYGVYHHGETYFDVISQSTRKMGEGLQTAVGRRQLLEELDLLEVAKLEAQEGEDLREVARQLQEEEEGKG